MVAVLGIKLTRDLPEGAGGHSSPARRRLRERAVELVRMEGLAEGSFCYRLAPIEQIRAGHITVDGESIEAPRLLPDCGQLTDLAFAACTLGPRLESRVSQLFRERQAALAVALDELGNLLLVALNRRVQDRMLAETRRRKLAMAGELRAGDPGLALSAQGSALRLAQADRIGLTLSAGGLLTPLKSLTMVLGVGRDLPEVQWSRCDDCRSRDRCNYAAA